MATSIYKPNIEIKNKKFVCNHDYIWFKGCISFTQNWHCFLLSYKNGYRFITDIIVNNIFIGVNEY